jgi:hypothetical protein
MRLPRSCQIASYEACFSGSEEDLESDNDHGDDSAPKRLVMLTDPRPCVTNIKDLDQALKRLRLEDRSYYDSEEHNKFLDPRLLTANVKELVEDLESLRLEQSDPDGSDADYVPGRQGRQPDDENEDNEDQDAEEEDDKNSSLSTSSSSECSSDSDDDCDDNEPWDPEFDLQPDILA